MVFFLFLSINSNRWIFTPLGHDFLGDGLVFANNYISKDKLGMSDIILLFQVVWVFGVVHIVDFKFEGLLLLEAVLYNDIVDKLGVKVVRHDLCLAHLVKLPVSIFLVQNNETVGLRFRSLVKVGEIFAFER